jgi:type 1 glutamine amidotransferase
VGGKYILEGTEEVKGSTYQHDVELFIRPAEKHPITLGLGPMHFVDETYKNMWISEEVNVLLEVDQETSDGPVAWISPYPKSRVVAIQLGHDKHAFMNPGYRELIRRSILWAANRLE